MRIHLDELNRIVIPPEAHRDLGLQPGEAIFVESDGSSLLIRRHADIVRETQEYFRPFLREGVSEVDELIQDRRAEAAKEENEFGGRRKP